MRIIRCVLCLVLVMMPVAVARAGPNDPAVTTPPLPAPQPAALASPPAKQSQVPIRYTPQVWSPEGAHPVIGLSSNADGSATAKLNITWTWDYLADKRTGASVYTGVIAPTLSFTDNTKSGLFSVGTTSGSTSATPNYGVTSISAGLMLGLTEHADIIYSEEVAILVNASKTSQDEIDTCSTRCKCDSSPASPENNCPAFCEVSKLFNGKSYAAADFDHASLCMAGQQLHPEKDQRPPPFLPSMPKEILEQREDRARFPKRDLSLWAGVGASQFAYYLQNPAATNAAISYASINKWLPNAGAALQFTALPTPVAVGLTFEVPAFLKIAYQASKTTGMACVPLGAGPSSGSTLSSCSPTQAIGAPMFGVDLVAEGYFGWVERHGYGRVAFGGGVDRSFVTQTNVWSAKLPIYINGSGVAKGATSSGGSGGTSSSPSTQASSPVPLSYDGILRVTPTFQYREPNQTLTSGPAWNFLVSFELLATHNLFTRADNLVK